MSALFVSAIIFICLTVFSSSYSADNRKLISDIENTQDEINDHRNEISPYVGLDFELKNAREDLENLAILEREQNRLWNSVLFDENNISNNWKNKDSESVNSTLIRQFSQLRKLCKEKYVILPGQNNSSPSVPFLDNTPSPTIEFGFGFRAYDGNWPNFSEEESQKLGIQMAIIKQIVEYLSKSTTANHPLSLVRISRESVGPIDERNIGVDKLDLSQYNKKLLKPHKIVNSMCFEIIFIGKTSSARTFMNQLTPPYLLRDFVANRVTSNNSSNLLTGPAAFTSPNVAVDQNTEVPIVQEVKSKYVFSCRICYRIRT
ncbi:hypothetical protein OAK38_06815 [Verrucomicrobia bacterium]|nr:hypothetical protein [Verrucomicrobiota bacterium]